MVGTGKINSLQQHQLSQQLDQNQQRDEQKRKNFFNRLRQNENSPSDTVSTNNTIPESSTQTQVGGDQFAEFKNDSSSPSTNEQCVKTIVERLETINTTIAPIVPRIIESKCIEKLAAPTEAVTESHAPTKHPVITVNNSIAVSEATTVAADKEQVVPSKPKVDPVVVKPAANAATKSTSPEQLKVTKVRRNRNVDLALSTVVTTANSSLPLKNVTVKSATSQSLNRPLKDPKETMKENFHSKPILTTFSQQHQLKQQSRQLNPIEESIKSTKDNVLTVINTEGTTTAKGSSDGDLKGQQKLLKWCSLSGTFDEKHYVTNDSKLKQKKIYDEMEFEEFEVYDAANKVENSNVATSNSNECYDSLNSNK